MLAPGRTACVVCLILVWTCGPPAVSGQSQSAPATQELINQLVDPDTQKVRAAADALMRQRPQVILALLEALDTRQECQMQFVASAVLRKFEPAHRRIEATLARVARGECTGVSQQDVVFKQDSAYALSYTASGMRCVTLEALQQASASKHASIAAAGKEVLAGRKMDCRR